MGAQNLLHRECHSGYRECFWCGSLRQRLFRYGRLYGWFCNLQCAMSFHDFNRSNFDYIEYPERR